MFCCAVLIPLVLLIFCSIEIELNRLDLSAISANITRKEDKLTENGRLVYVEYRFAFNGSLYEGAGSKSFSAKSLTTYKMFFNATDVNVFFCKSDPASNSLDKDVCHDEGYYFGVAITASLLGMFLLAFFTNGGGQCLWSNLKRILKAKKQSNESTGTPEV